MPATLLKRRILIVDDEDDIRALLGATLQDEGCVLAYASDGPRALAAVRRDKPDLVLLDVVMPGMLGWDVLKAIKADPDTKSVKVAMLTALIRASVTRMAFDMGADGYLMKPFSVAAALQKVHELLGVKE